MRAPLESLALAFLLGAAGEAAAAQSVALRADVRASGPALTLGDVFEIEGDAARREIAPAPDAGRKGAYSASMLAAAARAAGYEWTPPAGVTQVLVQGPQAAGPSEPLTAPTFSQAGTLGVKRGDIVTLSYATPGLRLSARMKAVSNGVVGGPVRLVNLSSAREVEAIVSGPGEAVLRTP